MKKILFDFLTFQDKIINGGYLYARTVLMGLLEKGCKIVGICEDEKALNQDIVKIAKENEIKVYSGLDKIAEVVKTEDVDAFFIGIAQRYNSINLTNVPCEVYVACHDVWELSLNGAGIDDFAEINKTIYKLQGEKKGAFKLFVKNILKGVKNLFSSSNCLAKYNYLNFAQLIKKSNVHVITVSAYSKHAIEYYFEDIANQVEVFACPKIARLKEEVGDNIKKTVANKKYFLLLSANRYNKNVNVFLKQFAKFNAERANEYTAILVGTDYVNEKENVIGIKRVNDGEIAYLMQNAYALIYPTLVEGFGLPPVEAMEFGTPVIASYNTSVPEVCGDGALYFNALYPEDLYAKCKLLEKNYQAFSDKAKKRYVEITKKMEEGLENLLTFIAGN